MNEVHVVTVKEVASNEMTGIVGPFASEELAMDWAVKHAERKRDKGNTEPTHTYGVVSLTDPY